MEYVNKTRYEIKDDFIKLIESKLGRSIPLDEEYINNPLEWAVGQGCDLVQPNTLNYTEHRLFRYIFEEWKTNLSMLEGLSKPNTPVLEPLFGLQFPLDFSRVMKLKNLLVDVEHLKLF